MAGEGEEEEEEGERGEPARKESVFEWDDHSQLYYHANSGFYHDPVAGWYYSTRDGLYYTFENGTYVLLEPHKVENYEAEQQKVVVSNHQAVEDDPCQAERENSNETENPPPPSEWLEETLIDLYLSGYSDSRTKGGDDQVTPSHIDDRFSTDDGSEIEEGEWIPEDTNHAAELSKRICNEGGASWDEENWQAQYGQVVHSEEAEPLFPVTDLWDWTMVKEIVERKKHGRKRRHQIARLVGKLVKPSSKLHPSMPSGGRILKTAAICEVHLALVRVSSGQVYRLRSPSLKYLSSLSTYDSSNPTKDWGFPDLTIAEQDIHLPNIGGSCNHKTPDELPPCGDPSAMPDQPKITQKDKSSIYRDRAAERRMLHGGYGIGPGQKNSRTMDMTSTSSPVSSSTEEAAAEALDMSFGTGSYARRIMESMGWKEGEALGSSTKGLKEPLVAVGNKGNAGLGWDQCRLNHS